MSSVYTKQKTLFDGTCIEHEMLLIESQHVKKHPLKECYIIFINDGLYAYKHHYGDIDSANVVGLNLLFKGEFHFDSFVKLEEDSELYGVYHSSEIELPEIESAPFDFFTSLKEIQEEQKKPTLESKLKSNNLKKSDFIFKILDKRVYPGGVVFTWVECEVNGKTYQCGDPYQGKRTTEVKNSLIASVLYQIEEEKKEVYYRTDGTPINNIDNYYGPLCNAFGECVKQKWMPSA